jgi:predicted ATPase
MLIIKQIGGITYNTIDLVGESGIGKSALLDEIYRRLSEQEEGQINQPFIGYYSKKVY